MKRLTCILLLALFASLLPAADAPPLKVARAQRGDITRFVTIPGTVRANQQATLYAKVAGYLKTIKVDKGDSVKAGELVAEIEVPELLADAAKYRAEIKVATADYRRVSVAQKKAPDLVMPQTVDEALGKLDVAKANLERVETLLHYSKITAPFDGVVTMRHVDAGAFIPAATSGSTTQTAALATLMDFNVVRVQVAVPEAEASLVRAGQPVKVSVEGLPGRTFEGTVTRHSYALDDASRTLLVEADFQNAQKELRPGMYAMVKVGVEKHTGALLIPVEALVMEKVNAFAFTADGGKAKKTPIKIGFNDGAKVEVLDGLAENAAVILVGKMTLTDGQSVNVTEAK